MGLGGRRRAGGLFAGIDDEDGIDGRTIVAAIDEQLGPALRDEAPMPASVDRICSGTAGRLVLPGTGVSVADLDRGTGWSPAGGELPPGEYLLAVRTDRSVVTDQREPAVILRFAGPASVDRASDRVVVSFWERTGVTVGRRRHAGGPPRLTIEPSVGGVARAITHFSAAHRTTGPARSHPAFRDHPPIVQLGDRTEIPRSVRHRADETDVEFHLPESLEALYVAAPLAYYLGARVRPTGTAEPRLVTADGAVDYAFDPLPAFQHQCAQLLRRTFYLDCRVRRVASGRGAGDGRLETRFGLDPDAVRPKPPGERLARYVDVPTGELDAALPEWHLTTYVAPEGRHVRTLPYLLDRMSLIYSPQGSIVNERELLRRTLADAYPTRGDAACQRVVEPVRHAGRVHGWLAPGTPIDAFETRERAFRNQLAYPDRDRERVRFTVVLNDDEMAAEHRAVADIYRDCTAALPVDVRVCHGLSRSALAAVFERDTDFVHYVGHCEDGGLTCPDGTLDANALEVSRARTFFLNACGSHDQGVALVERGSVAGAATFRPVLDRQAARVGTAFARLIVHGFGFERALALARRRILMGKDYAVVGDGTYALLPTPNRPAVVWIADGPSGGYDVTCEVANARTNGRRYRLPFAEDRVLNGRTVERRFSASELRDALSGVSVPVVFEGDLTWSEDVVERL